MASPLFNQKLTFLAQRLEQLWRQADELPQTLGNLWQQADEFPEQMQELLIQNSQELSIDLYQLQQISEELLQQNEALTESYLAIESELQKYVELFEFAPDGYIVTDKHANILKANRAAAQLLNIPQDHLVKKPFATFVAPQECQNFYSKLNQIQQGKSLKHWQVQMQPRHSAAFPALFTVVPIQNLQGEVEGFRWRLMDWDEADSKQQSSLSKQPAATCRQPPTASIQQLGEVLDTIFSNSPELLLIHDRTGKCCYVNQAAAQAFGVAKSDFTGKTWQQLGLTPQILAQWEAQREIVFAQGKSITDKATIPTTDSLRDYEYSIRHMGKINNRLEAVVTLAKDITEYKQSVAAAHTALTQAQEESALKTQYIYTFAYEARNPLNAILLCAQLRESHVQSSSDKGSSRLLLLIQENAKRINQLLNDLLLIEKLKAGQVPLNPILLDLNQFCRQLIEELKQQAGQEHRITFLCPEQYSPVRLDKQLLQYILSHLLLNLVKYSPQQSEIQLKIAYQKEQVMFVIRIFGKGISKQYQQLLSNWLERGNNIVSVQSNGFGLALVNPSVALCQGKISVESQVEFKTTITVTLPLLREIKRRRVGILSA